MIGKYNPENITCHYLNIVRFIAFCIFIGLFSAVSLNAGELIEAEKIDIAKVWAGHPVNFAIKTKNDYQCVAYYDTNRQMIIAARKPGETVWKYTSLNTKTGWDSHNYIDMAIDDSGYIHVSGNMHNVSLIYFRSKKPWSIDEFEQPGMVGTLESSVTYPVFIEGPKKQLLFQYRIGGSGDGITIWNGYDPVKKKWSRITDKGLFDNAGSVNAYPTAPILGPDSCFHIVWMWRDSPVANTNHDLSHMKSADLVNWKNMAGKTVSIPVGQSNKDVVADPVASGRGLINMDFWISWDTRNRAVVTYHRYDAGGYSQIFNTRWEDNLWKIYQTSDWKGIKWELDLTGSLAHDIAATALSVNESGKLVQNYKCMKPDIYRWVLDEATLKPVQDALYTPPAAMTDFHEVESKFSGMQVNWIQDGEYYIRWESMPINQDNARTAGTYPSSSNLRLYRYTMPVHAVKDGLAAAKNSYIVEKNGFRIAISYSGLKSGASFQAAIYSLEGRKICQKLSIGNKCCVISVASLPEGIYLIKMRSNGPDAETVARRMLIY